MAKGRRVWLILAAGLMVLPLLAACARGLINRHAKIEDKGLAQTKGGMKQ
jgi:hypothetical protein